MSETQAEQPLIPLEDLRVLDRQLFDEETLRRVYFESGSKDNMTEALIQKTTDELIAFGVSPYDVVFHLIDQAKKIKEKEVT